LSIARAVRRYLGVSEFPMQLLDAAKFVEVLLKRHG